MRTRYELFLILLAAAVFVFPPSRAGAVELELEGSTLFGYSEDQFFFNYLDARNKVTLRQYLLANVDGLLNGKLTFHSYMSAGLHLADKDIIEGSSDFDLLYGYAALHLDKADRTQLRVGRIFRLQEAASAYFDGLQLLAPLGPVDLDLYGGFEVGPYHGFDKDAALAGLRLSGTLLKKLDVGLSFLYTNRDGESDRGIVGLELGMAPAKDLWIEANVAYSYLLNGLADTTAVVRYGLRPNLRTAIGFQRRVPASYLGQTSVFTRFELEAINDFWGELAWSPFQGFKLQASLHAYLYADDDTWELRTALSYRYGTERENVAGLTYERQVGFGDDGDALVGRWRQRLNKHLFAGLRASLLFFNRDALLFLQYRDADDWASSAIASMEWQFMDKMSVVASGGVETLQFDRKRGRGSLKLRYRFATKP